MAAHSKSDDSDVEFLRTALAVHRRGAENLHWSPPNTPPVQPDNPTRNGTEHSLGRAAARQSPTLPVQVDQNADCDQDTGYDQDTEHQQDTGTQDTLDRPSGEDTDELPDRAVEPTDSRQRLTNILPPVITESRWQLAKPALWGTALLVLVVVVCVWWGRPSAHVEVVSRSSPLAIDGDPPATSATSDNTAASQPGSETHSGGTAPNSKHPTPGTASSDTAASGTPGPKMHGPEQHNGQPTTQPTNTTTTTPQQIPVHIVGQVKKPGVWYITEGSLVIDAVTKAGGLTPQADATAINLARRVTAGEHIHVPAPGEKIPTLAPAPNPTPQTSTTPGTDSPTTETGNHPADNNQKPRIVNINTATTNELEQLPGIGPVTANRIVQWRQENGPFMKPAELRQVRGIGPALMKQLKGRITI